MLYRDYPEFASLPKVLFLWRGVVMKRILAAALATLSFFVVGGVSANAESQATTAAGILAAAEHVANAKPVTLDVAARQLSERGQSSVQAFVCVGNVFIVSAANGLAVSAELGYPGPFYAELRARAGAIGPWELFTVCQDDVTGVVVFISQANGLLVSAELGYGEPFYGLLRARTGALGPWEQFALLDGGGGAVAILSLANGRLVSAELGFPAPHTGALRARATALGPWERFL